MSSRLRVMPAAISLAHAASSMIRGLGPICACIDGGRMSTRRGPNRPVIHSHSIVEPAIVYTLGWIAERSGDAAATAALH